MLVVAGVGHELVGIDAGGQLCRCGVKDAAFVEHLADVLTAVFGVNRYWVSGTGARWGQPERPRIVLKEAA